MNISVTWQQGYNSVSLQETRPLYTCFRTTRLLPNLTDRIFLSSLIASSFFLHTIIKIWILYLVRVSLVDLGPFIMHGAFSLWTSPASWAVTSAVTQGPVLRSAPHWL